MSRKSCRSEQCRISKDRTRGGHRNDGYELQPIATLLGFLWPLAYVNPLAYGVDALRALVLGPEQGAFPLGLAVLGLAGFALATMAAWARRLRAV